MIEAHAGWDALSVLAARVVEVMPEVAGATSKTDVGAGAKGP